MQTWHTTGSLARQLGVSREQILADIARLGIIPIRDAIGRRLLTGSHVARITKLHAQRRRRQGGQALVSPRKIDPGAS